jgi:hypothetical protein
MSVGSARIIVRTGREVASSVALAGAASALPLVVSQRRRGGVPLFQRSARARPICISALRRPPRRFCGCRRPGSARDALEKAKGPCSSAPCAPRHAMRRVSKRARSRSAAQAAGIAALLHASGEGFGAVLLGRALRSRGFPAACIAARLPRRCAGSEAIAARALRTAGEIERHVLPSCGSIRDEDRKHSWCLGRSLAAPQGGGRR